MWERLWPALASLATAIGLFLALSWTGLWLALPPVGRAVGLFLLLVLTAISAVPLFRLRRPTTFDGLRRLDRGSGLIRVHNFWCAIDVGIAVQPDNVVAQTESSIVYGLGLALYERISIKNGAVEQSNFYDYHLPRMNQVPQMHIEVISTDNHPTGAGQMATPLVAPAIASAVAQLTGVRIRHTPFTPERVKEALG